MERRDKLSALGRLAAGVAHDVRNPLHSIGLTLEHLSEAVRPESPEQQEEFQRSLAVIRGEIRRLDRLVENFLRFAKTERHERRLVDLGEILVETLRLVQKEAERRKVEIELAVPDGLPPVLADGAAIHAAVLNVVLNSFEAMPDGGRLAVALRAEDGRNTIEVVDTGQGIPEAEQERVFDFAYSTRAGGNGLGLAMVHHCIVEEHGGKVSLESRVGQGTRVRMTLPVATVEPS
jgi:signal transduction histidine kinase